MGAGGTGAGGTGDRSLDAASGGGGFGQGGAGGRSATGGAPGAGGVGTGGAAPVDAGRSSSDATWVEVPQRDGASDVPVLPVLPDGGALLPADNPDPSSTVPEGAGCYVQTQPPPPRASNCPANFCGNGLLDTCTIASTWCDHGYCPPATASEECDGTAPLGQTCESLGFARGTLRCGSTCHVDWSACGVCGTDSRIVKCAEVEGVYFDHTGQTLAVASNGTQAAIVWPAKSAGANARLRFGLVGEDLSVVASDCFAAENANWAPRLAATPEGWMLAHAIAAGDGTRRVQLTIFDTTGHMVSSPTATLLGIPTGLVARPNGMPLLLYQSDSDGANASADMAALLDSSGTPIWTVRLGNTISAIPVAAHTGDGFLWANRAALGADPVLIRVGLDGTTTPTTLALGEDNYDPRLVWTGTEARMLWYGSWIALDKTGKALGPIHRLTSDRTLSPEAASLGTGTAVLLVPVLDSATSTGPRALVMIDAGGNATQPATIFADGNRGRMHAIVAVRDRLLAVALTGDSSDGSTLHLAWIRP
jgi:hypothetical protein